MQAVWILAWLGYSAALKEPRQRTAEQGQQDVTVLVVHLVHATVGGLRGRAPLGRHSENTTQRNTTLTPLHRDSEHHVPWEAPSSSPAAALYIYPGRTPDQDMHDDLSSQAPRARLALGPQAARGPRPTPLERPSNAPRPTPDAPRPIPNIQIHAEHSMCICVCPALRSAYACVYVDHAALLCAAPCRATNNPMHSFDHDVDHGQMHEEDYSKFGQKSQTKHDASPRRRLMHVRLAEHAPAVGDPTCACVATNQSFPSQLSSQRCLARALCGSDPRPLVWLVHVPTTNKKMALHTQAEGLLPA